MMVVTTKYLGPTTHKGSRIKVTVGDHSIIVPYHSELDEQENHLAAVKALWAKYQWPCETFHYDSTATGYVFVREFPGNRLEVG